LIFSLLLFVRYKTDRINKQPNESITPQKNNVEHEHVINVINLLGVGGGKKDLLTDRQEWDRDRRQHQQQQQKNDDGNNDKEEREIKKNNLFKK